MNARKSLRLKYYDYSQNGYYFVTLCTYKKQKLFKIAPIIDYENLNEKFDFVNQNKNERFFSNEIIIKQMLAMEENFKIIIDQLIIMPDHLHFIIIIPETERHKGRSLPQIMQWLKSITTNAYINLVKQNILKPFYKKIWQKSYFDHVIRNEKDYLNIKKYIFENPLKYELLHQHNDYEP